MVFLMVHFLRIILQIVLVIIMDDMLATIKQMEKTIVGQTLIISKMMKLLKSQNAPSML